MCLEWHRSKPLRVLIISNSNKYKLLYIDLSLQSSYDEIAPRNGSEQQKQCIEELLLGDAPFRKFMRPEFIRLAPPLHVAQDEVYFIK